MSVVHAEAPGQARSQERVIIGGRTLVEQGSLIRCLPATTGAPRSAHDDAVDSTVAHVQAYAFQTETFAGELDGEPQHAVCFSASRQLIDGRQHG
jgi:hypothetical protein